MHDRASFEGQRLPNLTWTRRDKSIQRGREGRQESILSLLLDLAGST